MDDDLYDDEHRLFRESFRAFLRAEVIPHLEAWDRAGIVPRELFQRAGEHGFVGMAVPEEHGGAGIDDFRFNAIIAEESAYAGASGPTMGITLHNDVCTPYFLGLCDGDQAARWLPGIASGESITAIAMTEPTTGSDLASIRTAAVADGDDYVLNGTKTFITNGVNADLVVVAATTDPAAGHRGVTLFVVERGTAGFERGRKLAKLGLHAQDTAELFFEDVRVPAANRLGAVGEGFGHLMANLAQERMSIAVTSLASAEAAIEWAVEHVRTREAFGAPLGALQSTRFALAECLTEARVTRAFVERCLRRLLAGRLGAEEAAMAKWWSTETQGRVVDRCLQLFGGYGFMIEYPIARAYADARATRLYGGTTEVMKEIIGRSMGLA